MDPGPRLPAADPGSMRVFGADAVRRTPRHAARPSTGLRPAGMSVRGSMPCRPSRYGSAPRSFGRLASRRSGRAIGEGFNQLADTGRGSCRQRPEPHQAHAAGGAVRDAAHEVLCEVESDTLELGTESFRCTSGLLRSVVILAPWTTSAGRDADLASRSSHTTLEQRPEPVGRGDAEVSDFDGGAPPAVHEHIPGCEIPFDVEPRVFKCASQPSRHGDRVLGCVARRTRRRVGSDAPSVFRSHSMSRQ